MPSDNLPNALKSQQDAFRKGMLRAATIPSASHSVHNTEPQPMYPPMTSYSNESNILNHSSNNTTATATSSTSMAAVDRHVGVLLHSVIAFLKSNQQSQPCAFTSQHLATTLFANTFGIRELPDDLKQHLQNNPKVIYHPADQTYSYRPLDRLSGPNELLGMLKSAYPSGIEMDELKESYDGVKEVVDKLISSRAALYVLRGSGSSGTSTLPNAQPSMEQIRVLYWNQQLSTKPADQAIQDIWHNTAVPHELDVEKRLLDLGMRLIPRPSDTDTNMDAMGNLNDSAAGLGVKRSSRQTKLSSLSSSSSSAGSQGSKSKRPTRITNVHLEGLFP